MAGTYAYEAIGSNSGGDGEASNPMNVVVPQNCATADWLKPKSAENLLISFAWSHLRSPI
jgi:hypothetical protein